MKIVFFGSPEPARIILAALLESPHEVVAVVTQPDKRRGRGTTKLPTPVKELAQQYSIEVFEPDSKIEVERVVRSVDADVGIVVAYGRILSASVLTSFRFGCINVHYSLLPRWRGAAPVERAILEGDTHSGISIMSMDEGLDTGPIYDAKEVDITDTTTSADLFNSLNAIAPEMLLNVIGNLDRIKPSLQAGEANYANKLSPNDFYFDTITSMDQIDRKVRAAAQLKGAWTTIEGEVFRLHRASIKPRLEAALDVGDLDRQGLLKCIDGVLKCELVQVPGKPVMDFSSWANGVPVEKFPLRIAT